MSSSNKGKATTSELSDLQKQKIVKKTVVKSVKWIQLSDLEYSTPDGRVLHWEVAERTTRKGDVDAVFVVARVKSKTHIILVAQFRPPVGAVCVEFPAGLVDANETLVAAGLRELKEETGYVGVVTGTTGAWVADPGMTSANGDAVFVDIDDSIPPVAAQEEDEFIKVMEVPIKGLTATLKKMRDEDGMVIDGRVMMYAMGLEAAQHK